ncbi:hypothetical protein, partial [Vibrio algivorus]|uniref:hypothetical protein n=1 Tax=Vibrio algivorus TaxID=1667024 RepID=UPI001C904D80
PNNFIRLAKGTKYTKSILSNTMESIPYWVYSVFDENLNYSRYRATEEEYRNAISYLYSINETISIKNVAQILGVHVSSCRNRLRSLKNINTLD